MPSTVEKPNIFIPSKIHGHKGDSFREILSMWDEMGWVSTHTSPDRYVWMNSPGDVLLHDHPQIADVVPHPPNYRLALWGNTFPENPTERDVRWIFWPRNPRILHNFISTREDKPTQFRYIHSCFIGKVENPIQFQNRFNMRIDWTKHIDLFEIAKGVQTPYPYDPGAYLLHMWNSRYALCLPGYGPKCHREIEAMAVGAIPVFTLGCCTDYYDKLVEGQNYFMIRSEDDIPGILGTNETDHLEHMRRCNLDWYNRNCGVRGSFETTMRIVNEHR